MLKLVLYTSARIKRENTNSICLLFGSSRTVRRILQIRMQRSLHHVLPRLSARSALAASLSHRLPHFQSNSASRLFHSSRAPRVLIPTVVSRTDAGERSFDLYSRLLAERIVFLSAPIDDNIASILAAQLLFLESEDPSKPISLYINSPGGSVTAGFAIYDTIQVSFSISATRNQPNPASSSSLARSTR